MTTLMRLPSAQYLVERVTRLRRPRDVILSYRDD